MRCYAYILRTDWCVVTVRVTRCTCGVCTRIVRGAYSTRVWSPPYVPRVRVRASALSNRSFRASGACRPREATSLTAVAGADRRASHRRRVACVCAGTSCDLDRGRRRATGVASPRALPRVHRGGSRGSTARPVACVRGSERAAVRAASQRAALCSRRVRACERARGRAHVFTRHLGRHLGNRPNPSRRVRR